MFYSKGTPPFYTTPQILSELGPTGVKASDLFQGNPP